MNRKSVTWGFMATIAAWLVFMSYPKAQEVQCLTVPQFMQNIIDIGGYIIRVDKVDRRAYDEIIFGTVEDNNLIALVYQGCVLNVPIVFSKGIFTGVKI